VDARLSVVVDQMIDQDVFAEKPTVPVLFTVPVYVPDSVALAVSLDATWLTSSRMDP
jgi:hypothetical protein